MNRYPALGAAVLLAAGLGMSPARPVLAHPITPAYGAAQIQDDQRERADGGASPSYFNPTYYCLPSVDGNGILDDGDFSRAVDPGHGDGKTFGTVFAPQWVVAQRTIDFYGYKDAWPVPHGYCSVDLDGSGSQGVGAIEHTPVATTPGARYSVEFLFSGNFGCARVQHGPIVKKLRVEAVGKTRTAYRVFLWNAAHGHDAEHDIYERARWTFTASDPYTRLIFRSLDTPIRSNCGPVVAAISLRAEP